MHAKTITRNLTIAAATLLVLELTIGTTATYGIKKFYGLDQHSDILLIGHSQLMLATDKEQMEKGLGLKISKFCREGTDINDLHAMSRMYLDSPQADSLKYVIYGVDPYSFTPEGLSANSYKALYPLIYAKDMEAYIKKQADPLDYFLKKHIPTHRFNEDMTKNASLRGLMNDWSNKKAGMIDIEAYKRQLHDSGERNIQMDPRLMATFDKTIQLFTRRNIKVILLTPPTLDLLNDSHPRQFKAMTAWYAAYAQQNPLVEYWDFNHEYSSRHELFFDRLHVNAQGQEKVSAAITRKLIETHTHTPRHDISRNTPIQ